MVNKKNIEKSDTYDGTNPSTPSGESLGHAQVTQFLENASMTDSNPHIKKTLVAAQKLQAEQDKFKNRERSGLLSHLRPTSLIEAEKTFHSAASELIDKKPNLAKQALGVTNTKTPKL